MLCENEARSDRARGKDDAEHTFTFDYLPRNWRSAPLRDVESISIVFLLPHRIPRWVFKSTTVEFYARGGRKRSKSWAFVLEEKLFLRLDFITIPLQHEIDPFSISARETTDESFNLHFFLFPLALRLAYSNTVDGSRYLSFRFDFVDCRVGEDKVGGRLRCSLFAKRTAHKNCLMIQKFLFLSSRNILSSQKRKAKRNGIQMNE